MEVLIHHFARLTLDDKGNTQLASVWPLSGISDRFSGRSNKRRLLSPQCLRPVKSGVSARRRSRRKVSLYRSVFRANNLIRMDASEHLLRTWESFFRASISLSQVASIDERLATSDVDIRAACSGILSIIEGTSHAPKGLGYVQLSNLFDALERAIEKDRRDGRIHSQSGRGNATIAIDMYISSVSSLTGKEPQRSQIWTLRRLAHRWREFAYGSTFFLIIYSELLENLVKDTTNIDNATLKIIAKKAIHDIPENLLSVCTYLADELENSHNQLCDEAKWNYLRRKVAIDIKYQGYSYDN